MTKPAFSTYYMGEGFGVSIFNSKMRGRTQLRNSVRDTYMFCALDSTYVTGGREVFNFDSTVSTDTCIISINLSHYISSRDLGT